MLNVVNIMSCNCFHYTTQIELMQDGDVGHIDGMLVWCKEGCEDLLHSLHSKHTTMFLPIVTIITGPSLEFVVYHTLAADPMPSRKM